MYGIFCICAFADLRAQLFVALVDLHPQSGRPQLRCHLAPHSRGTSPRAASTIACTGASQSGNAPAKCSMRMPMNRSMRPEDGAVNHDRPMLGVVLADVRELEALRLRVIELDGAELPRPPDGVGDLELDLRPVEGAVARVDVVASTPFFFSAFSRALSAASHIASSPIRFSGRVDRLIRTSRSRSVVDLA